MLLFTGTSMLLFCPDTPVGRWSDREMRIQESLHSQGVDESPVIAVPGSVANKDQATTGATLNDQDLKVSQHKDAARLESNTKTNHHGHEVALSQDEILQTVQGEVIVQPSFQEALKVAISPPTLVVMACYFCSFGAELAINSILPSYYLKNFPTLGQTKASDWAAMFGFLNFVTRPLGGIAADVLYNRFGRSLWLKKAWMHACGALAGAFLIIAGRVDSHHLPTFTGLIALMAIFIEAGNGANFALVPHVHPYANGIVSGFTGGVGNLGGVVFAIIFRFMGSGTDYAKALWVIGCIHLGVNVCSCWIRPIPKGQVGGH